MENDRDGTNGLNSQTVDESISQHEDWVLRWVLTTVGIMAALFWPGRFVHAENGAVSNAGDTFIADVATEVFGGCVVVDEGVIHMTEEPHSERVGEQQRASPPHEYTPLIRELVKWIGDHTEYDISRTLNEPPEVSFCNAGTKIIYEGEEIIVDPLIRAAYDTRLRRINLVLPWDASNIRHRSRLLHELIHDVQFLNRGLNCRYEPEWQAYKLQELWLAGHGLESGFNWVQIFLLSRCPRDIHP